MACVMEKYIPDGSGTEKCRAVTINEGNVLILVNFAIENNDNDRPNILTGTLAPFAILYNRNY